MLSSARRGTVAVCDRASSNSKAAQQNVAGNPTVEAVNAVSQLLRRASTTESPRRTLTKGKGKADDMYQSVPAISPEEYQKLPHSIQRKYFSSEERLQIAQRSAVEKRQRQPSKKTAVSTPALRSTTSTEFVKRRKTVKKSDTKKQRRSSLPLIFTAEAAKGEAAWFDSLPEKVKRSQFDDNERTAFSQTAPLDRPHTSSSHKPILDHFCWDKNRSASAEVPRMPSSPCTTLSSHSPSPSFATSHSHESRASNRTPHSSRLPPALTIPKSRTPEQERLASRRNFLLHPIPLPPPVLAPVTTLLSPDTAEHLEANQFSSIIVRLEESPSDADITPTQELDMAHHKLKNAPPAWYDEKLDFGFDDRKPPGNISDAWELPRTLSPSISDTASSHGPMTPISPALHSFDLKPEHSTIQAEQNNVTNFSHLQSQRSYEVLKPRRGGPKHLVDGFYEGQATSQPYSITVHYDNQDPLALETLPVCDDLTGSQGAFAVHNDNGSRGFRKVLKVIRGH
ncbi:hypothetical protein AMS68_002418 [Peltaster fructicola]|uniref:Uncharacterized protein n=1 Tax=Peltaster fructicola TaxID=286661 RepID=A0A6H0XQH4_9PEZI|nr:hypothetical protein AMS68_002418 [Peltaster fructicola]